MGVKRKCKCTKILLGMSTRGRIFAIMGIYLILVFKSMPNIEMAPESPEEKQEATDVTQPRVFMPGSIHPDWRKHQAEAVRREFHERFSPYNLLDLEEGRKYYKKYRHHFWHS